MKMQIKLKDAIPLAHAMRKFEDSTKKIGETSWERAKRLAESRRKRLHGIHRAIRAAGWPESEEAKEKALDAAIPTVGDGATVHHYSDEEPATVLAVDTSKSRIVVTVQIDNWTRTDSNGMSDSQAYDYSPNPDGEVLTVVGRPRTKKRCSGWYVREEHGSIGYRVTFRGRTRYHDYSF